MLPQRHTPQSKAGLDVNGERSIPQTPLQRQGLLDGVANGTMPQLNKPVYSCDIVVNEAMSECMTCKRTSIALTGEDLKSPSGQQTVEALLESEAKKYNIPKPKVLF